MGLVSSLLHLSSFDAKLIVIERPAVSGLAAL